MKCQRCGSENDSRARFCAICGASIGGAGYLGTAGVGTKTCPNCGQTMSSSMLICANCGHSTEVGQRYQTPYDAQPHAVITPGRKFIALGLIAIGLYFLWWGFYSAYIFFTWDWEVWSMDYVDMVLSFIVGGLVLAAGMISMTKR